MWREPDGLFAFDMSRDEDHPMLAFFIGGPAAASMHGSDAAAVVQAALAWLVPALGEAAGRPLDVTLRDWTGDRWSGGAYSDIVVDVSATDAEDIIRAGAPPLFFASSEMSPSYPGYIEGAIVAGREAASRIMASLGR